MTNRRSFIDCDDLKDLDTLFEVVGNETDTLLALCSAELLRRVWCVGEIATAWHKQTPVIRLELPEFKAPDEYSIADCRALVPGVVAFEQHGITTKDVQQSIRWVLHAYEVHGVKLIGFKYAQ